MQTPTPWQKPLCLAVIDAAEETHEFGHCVAVEPWGTEGVFADEPALGEDGKVDDGGAGGGGGGGEDGEDGGVGVVEEEGADGGEFVQTVFVGDVGAVPGDDVEGSGGGFGTDPEALGEFGEEGVVCGLGTVEGGDGGEKVPGVGETVGADCAEIGERKVGLEEFEAVALGGDYGGEVG